MYKIKNLISLILVLAICFSFAVPIGATEIGASGQEASVPVTINMKAARFSVTVPTGLPVNVDENGTVVTATDAKIINNSIAPVKVENVQVVGQNGWELIAFDTDKSTFKIDEKKIGLKINSTNEVTQADGSFAFDDAQWRALNTSGDANDLDKYIIDYDAIIAPQSENVTNAIVANVVFTVDWDKVAAVEDDYDHDAPELHPSGTIPEGAIYANMNTGIYSEMPATVSQGDVYLFEDYIYSYGLLNNRYNSDSDGWAVNLASNDSGYLWNFFGIDLATWLPDYPFVSIEETSYAPILESINGVPVVSMLSTFEICESLLQAPAIPEKVIDMNSTFAYCVSLTTAPIIPDSVTSMDNTFTCCESLKTYVGSTDADGDFSNYIIPDSVTNMSDTFSGCISMTMTPVIPNSVTDMSSTFSGCTNITTAPVIPNGVTTLDDTFDSCTSLVEAPAIPDSVTNMTETFSHCEALKTYVGSTDTDGDFSNYIIPKSVTTISGTFYGCTALIIAPTIPSSVMSMGNTFNDCANLTAAPVIPNGVTDMVGAFSDCTSLTGIIEINANQTSYTACFKNIDFSTQNITLTGSSTLLDGIGATGLNYCADCNGKCQNNH